MASGSVAAPPPIGELNAASPPTFAAALAPLFEGAPRFLLRLADARPFDSYEQLFAQARAIARSMPEEERLELIDAHPRIGASPDGMSELSYREQGYDRAATGGSDKTDAVRREHAAVELGLLNAAYEARFGFRFVVFVAGRPRDELLPVLEERLQASPAEEIDRALGDVVAIAEDRWRKLAVSTPEAQVEPG